MTSPAETQRVAAEITRLVVAAGDLPSAVVALIRKAVHLLEMSACAIIQQNWRIAPMTTDTKEITETITFNRPNGIKETVTLSTNRATFIEGGKGGKPSIYMWLSRELVSTAPKTDNAA